jgi:hypothetical protein
MDRIEWDVAKKIIHQKIVQGTDLNTKRSRLRKVIQDNYPCTKYDYNGENGFLVSISNYDNTNLEIPWSMLEKCVKRSKKYSKKDEETVIANK